MIRSALAMLAAAALLAGCAPGNDLGTVHVDVDTPALRAQKAAARVEPCVQPTTEPHSLGTAGLPDVTLPCLGGGESVDLARLRGPLVITFWASWCGPCKRELPIFQRFAKKYAGRVAVLGIDTNDVRPDAALDLIATSGVRFPLLADPATKVAAGGLRVIYLPTLAFIDADGRLTTWSSGDGGSAGEGSDSSGGSATTKAMEIESLRELEALAIEHLGADVLRASDASPTPAPTAAATKAAP
jgi:thiol-disulfide isomerase/thioredoxin